MAPRGRGRRGRRGGVQDARDPDTPDGGEGPHPGRGHGRGRGRGRRGFVVENIVLAEDPTELRSVDSSMLESDVSSSLSAVHSLLPSTSEEEQRQLRLAMEASVNESHRRRQMEEDEYEEQMRRALRESLREQTEQVQRPSRTSSSEANDRDDPSDDEEADDDSDESYNTAEESFTEDRLLASTSALSDRVKRAMESTFSASLELRRSLGHLRACEAITTSLFPHQMAALMWMSQRENSDLMGVKGGILADDMGLGKSLVVIALVLTNFYERKPLAKPEIGHTRSYIPGVLRYMPSSWINALPKLEESTKGMKGRERMKLVFEAAKKGAANAAKEAAKNNSKNKYKGVKRRRRHDSDKVVIVKNDDDDDENEGANGNPIQVSSDDDDDEFAAIANMPSLKERAGIKDDDLALPGPSGIGRRVDENDSDKENDDKDFHFGDGLSDDEEYMSMTEEERNRRYGMNMDGGSEVPSEASDLENLVVPPKEPFSGKYRRRATLIVTPASLISQWVQQIEEHVDRRVRLAVFVHHGTSKAYLARELADQDFVFTTYGTLGAEFNAQAHSPLLGVKWLRVVLDEGHYIKNHLTKTAKAAAHLDTMRKWIVSGTPVQNNLKEFWCLLSWLEFEPYASNRPLFRDEIERLASQQDPRGLGRLEVLAEAIVLRRTKSDVVNGRPLISLPPKNVTVKEVEFSREEEVVYRAFEKNTREKIHKFLRRGTLMRNYAHIFELMIRLRQLCCHRELINENWDSFDIEKFMAEAEREMDEELSKTNPEQYSSPARRLRDLLATGMTDECAICMGDYSEPVITKCLHIFCRPCICEYFRKTRDHGNRTVACPLCRRDVCETELTEAAPPTPEDEEDTNSNTGLQDPYEDIVMELSSTKINAAMKEVLGFLRDEPDCKIVIASQFTKLLSMLQPLLDEQGISWTRLDGTMNSRIRSTVVAQFQRRGDENSPKILLLSLKAGGVGLNLTAANRMILLDPAWNPSSEEQCFDRIHRVGQTKPVFITKLIMKNSIEERMLSIQERKRMLIRGVYGDSGPDRRQHRIQEIKDLFGL